MLSPADRALVRRDPVLPGLAVLLDPTVLSDALRRALPEAGVAHVTVEYLRYKPATSCLAAGNVLADGKSVPFYAKAFPRRAKDKLEKSRRPSRRETQVGPVRLVLEDSSIAVHVFPDDRKIGQLRTIGSRKKFAALLATILPGAGAQSVASVDSLRYNPERRWVGAVTLEGQRTPAAVLRLYAGAGFHAGHCNAEAFRSEGPLRIPSVLGASEGAKAFAVEWLPGAPLALDPEALEPTGAGLAFLHRQPAASLAQPDPRREISTLIGAVAAVTAACPELSRLASEVGRRLVSALSAAPDAFASVHGDFHSGQVIVGEGTVGLVDFDRAGRGDPATDFGSFLADLELRDEREAVDESLESLLAGYCSAGGVLPGPKSIRLRHAAALLKVAPHPFRKRHPSWPEHTAELLERAARILERDSVGRPRPLRDPGIPFLTGALDSRTVETGLRNLPAFESTDVRVEALRLLRHKPGRRCLVEYSLRVARAGGGEETMLVLGKIRAKGADGRAERLEVALRENAVRIPEPLGTVPELGMRLHRKVEGIPAPALLAGDGGAQVARRVADEIRSLHRAPVKPHRRHTAGTELRILEERLSAAARLRPQLADRIHRLLDECGRMAADLDDLEQAVIHRDFYPDQVLVDGDRIWLLDLDLCCLGDPALDAGNFLAHLTENGIRFPERAPALARAADAFEERAATLSGEDFQRRARIYTALSLARHVSLALEIPGRELFVGPVLAAAEAQVEAAAPFPARQLTRGGQRP